eukprot:Amastigsp_a1439_94.p2 type:complete len:315 gc:universal Amastigsp_a1439_94:30-974(+)
MAAVRLVKDSANHIVANAKAVSVDVAAAEQCADELLAAWDGSFPRWDEFEDHFHDGTDLTAQYILVLDALNFCFWPAESDAWEYDRLARSIKRAVLRSSAAISAQALAGMTHETLREWFDGEDPPVADERVRLLRELGTVLDDAFHGSAAELVRSAAGSATRLVDLVARYFPGFRDTSVFAGRQVGFYKRAQIFVGDIWGAFNGTGLGAFADIGELTCFPDYRIPQLLWPRGVLRYSDELAARVRAKEVLPAMCLEEAEIRGATVWAVEHMRRRIEERSGKSWTSVQIDWMLWQLGERTKDDLAPHHRVLTIFY